MGLVIFLSYKLTKRLFTFCLIDKAGILDPSKLPSTKLMYSGRDKVVLLPVKSIPCLLGWAPKAVPVAAANVDKGV